jgi:hypothetical protein
MTATIINAQIISAVPIQVILLFAMVQLALQIFNARAPFVSITNASVAASLHLLLVDAMETYVIVTLTVMGRFV